LDKDTNYLRHYKINLTLDVPEESGSLNFGVLLSGTGKIWIDNISFEIVDKMETKSTGGDGQLKKPTNLNFE
jgi:hypothetical protein